MSDPHLDYWSDVIGEAFCVVDRYDLWEQLTEEQQATIVGWLNSAHDTKDEFFGREEADRSVTRIHREEGENAIIREVEELCQAMDGSSRIFDVATHAQRMALGALFNFRDHLRRQKIKQSKAA